jgi:hypothetical protein
VLLIPELLFQADSPLFLAIARLREKIEILNFKLFLEKEKRPEMSRSSKRSYRYIVSNMNLFYRYLFPILPYYPELPVEEVCNLFRD